MAEIPQVPPWFAGRHCGLCTSNIDKTPKAFYARRRSP
jgi:hypothetical protein